MNGRIQLLGDLEESQQLKRIARRKDPEWVDGGRQSDQKVVGPVSIGAEKKGCRPRNEGNQRGEPRPAKSPNS